MLFSLDDKMVRRENTVAEVENNQGKAANKVVEKRNK